MPDTKNATPSKKFMVQVILMVDANDYDEAISKVDAILCDVEPCQSFIVKEPVETMEVIPNKGVAA